MSRASASFSSTSSARSSGPTSYVVPWAAEADCSRREATDISLTSDPDDPAVDPVRRARQVDLAVVEGLLPGVDDDLGPVRVGGAADRAGVVEVAVRRHGTQR